MVWVAGAMQHGRLAVLGYPRAEYIMLLKPLYIIIFRDHNGHRLVQVTKYREGWKQSAEGYGWISHTNAAVPIIYEQRDRRVASASAVANVVAK